MAVQFTNKVVADHYEADIDVVIKTKCFYGHISNISMSVAEQLIVMKHPGFREKPPDQPLPPAQETPETEPQQ